MRYGLVDGQQRTLEEIGLAFRVTRERVRQIEARALHKIKQPYRCHKLRDHMSTSRDVSLTNDPDDGSSLDPLSPTTPQAPLEFIQPLGGAPSRSRRRGRPSADEMGDRDLVSAGRPSRRGPSGGARSSSIRSSSSIMDFIGSHNATVSG
jgi:hypothetical protein